MFFPISNVSALHAIERRRKKRTYLRRSFLCAITLFKGDPIFYLVRELFYQKIAPMSTPPRQKKEAFFSKRLPLFMLT